MTDPSTTSAPDTTVGEASATDVRSTGHPAIDEALERLDRLDDLEISGHPDEFDAIHGVLRESLANAGRDGVVLDSP